MKRLLLAAAAAPLLLLAAPAEAKNARCAITAAGSDAYRGPCTFAPEGKGSFTVSPPQGRTLPGEVTSLTVGLVGGGLADVRGLTRDGINSRWGDARRSPKDRACWEGSDFRICVY